MVKIPIKGDIVDNTTAIFYSYFAIPCCSPKKISELINSASANEDLELEVSSNGGDVFAASEIYTMLKQYEGNVKVTIQGLAASAASVIAMAGDSVSISPTAQIMIHNAWTNVSGNADDFEHASDFLQETDKAICSAYELKTGMSQDELLQLMGKETWLNAQRAVDTGFADTILFKDEKQPQVINSCSSLPSKEAINKFLNLIHTEQHKNNKQNTTPPDSQLSESLRARKLAILFGKKSQGDVE